MLLNKVLQYNRMMLCQAHLCNKEATLVCSCLQTDALDDHVHAVLGGPEADVDTVAATLCLALHLSQVT